MKPGEYKNEAYDQNSILEWAKEWNQANLKTKRIIKIQSRSRRRNETKRTQKRSVWSKSNLEASEGMKPNERKNEAYDQNSIFERAKEWNQTNALTKRMTKIQSWSKRRNETKRTC